MLRVSYSDNFVRRPSVNTLNDNYSKVIEAICP